MSVKSVVFDKYVGLVGICLQKIWKAHRESDLKPQFKIRWRDPRKHFRVHWPLSVMSGYSHLAWTLIDDFNHIA